jgi:protein O-mannosyl-transferase
MKAPSERARLAGICAVLFFGTLLLFSGALKNDFLDYDDPDYITQNTHVQRGLQPETVRWAFASTAAGNWHPLTWLSHAADWQLFGANPSGHHATNILLHALNAILVFLVFRKLTGATWPSALCAALFAWHPLRVESVAWVAERKDLLCGFFFFLTLLSYAHYAENREAPNRKLFYGLTILFFAFGLMSKPMLVTLPFLLLLLDFWPLRRFDNSTLRRLLFEKLPLFILAAASCIVTFFAQKQGGAIVENLPLQNRLINSAVSIADYLGKFFWPFNLSVTYPLPSSQPFATAAFATILVVVLTLLAFGQARRRPWLLIGWLWFLGMLVPVLGLVQVGLQAMADRYTYLPMLGLQLALLWTFCELALSRNVLRIATAAAVLSLTGLAARTWDQISLWQNSKTLYEHALAVTKNNYLVESNLGTTLFNQGDLAGAELHFRRAIELRSNFATPRFKLAITLEELNRPDDALVAYSEFLELQPRDPVANYNAGVLLLNENQSAQAATRFQTALESDSNYTAALVGLALAKVNLNETTDAISALERALKMDPHFPGVVETLARLKQN